MERQELEDILEASDTPGEGCFSLDFYRATRLLSRHALADPMSYLYKLLQAAVAQGADWIEIETHPDSTELFWSGPPTRPEELQGLAPHLLRRDPQKRHLHHLAVALHTLWTLEPEAVTLLSCELRYQVRDGLTVLEARNEGPPSLRHPFAHNHLRIDRPRRKPDSLTGQMASWLGQSQRGEHELLACNQGRLQHGCVPIVINGRAVRTSVQEWADSARPEAHLYLDAYSPRALAAPAAPSRANLFTSLWTLGDDGSRLLPSEGGQPAQVPGLRYRAAGAGSTPALTCFARLWRTQSSWSSLTFVDDGVVLCEERNVLERPGISGVVSAMLLDTDLSEFGLVHNQVFQETMALLREPVRWLDQQRPLP